MKLLNNDSAKGRGFRTFIQAVVGFVVGLITAVWAVPGVSDVAVEYITKNLVNTLVLVGFPTVATGVVSWLWNVVRKDVKN